MDVSFLQSLPGRFNDEETVAVIVSHLLVSKVQSYIW